mmetsp:Transcript_16916/g.12019  ORF Transcript_16916/g.12019 Transcript_16916/m.12019 type:complete len:201 (-) Transcript_16916:1836-2438(-)
MAFNSLVCVKSTSVNITVFVCKSTLTLKSVRLPITSILVSILVVTHSVSIWLPFDKFTLVEVGTGEFFFTISCCKSVFPVTIVVTSSLVGELSFTMVKVVLETSFIKISVVLPAFSCTIALAVFEFSLSFVSISVSHGTPSCLATIQKLTNISFLVLSFFIGIGSLAIESVVFHLANILITFVITRGIHKSSMAISLAIN